MNTDNSLYNLLRELRTFNRHRRELRDWQRNGCPIPSPPLVKQRMLRAVAKEHKLRVLVETGTYLGDTAFACRNHFQMIYTIELDPILYQRAERRLGRYRHIKTLHGDSATILPTIVGSLNEPTLFWLDAHYSGTGTARGEQETPIERELSTILENSSLHHFILIDDCRHFDGTHDYPTIDDISTLIARLRHGWRVNVANDIIHITPSTTE